MKRAYFVCLFLFLAPSFLLSQTSPVPFVNQPLVPDAIAPGSSNFTLTVNGTGFVSNSSVAWNGLLLTTTFVNATKLTATVPAAFVTVPKTASVTVVSTGSIGAETSNAVPFTVTTPTSGLTFSTSTIPVGLDPATVLVADFNNDGISDLVVVNQDQPDPACYMFYAAGTISILLGKGDGTFSNKSTLCVPDSFYLNVTPTMVVGDFNNDGNPDLLVTYNLSPGAVGEIFLGNGDGTFTPGQVFGPDSSNFADLVFPSIAVDTNGDGNLDLAIPYLDDDGFDNVGILLGNGDGTFGVSSPLFNCPTSNCLESRAVVSGDFNGDGIPDLVSVAGFGNLISVFLGQGDGTFVPAARPSVTLVSPTFLTTGDFDGDGVLDVAIADAGSTALIVLHGNGDGTFTQVNGQPSLLQAPSFVTTADMNGDGKLDLIFLSPTNTISIFLGNGDGTFHAGLVQAVDFAPYGVAVGDFNGDGRLDLAVTNGSSGTLSILLQKPFQSGVAVSIASLQNPANIGESVTFTAVAWDAPAVPTGSITFKQGANILGTAPLVNGQAAVTTSFSALGSFPMVASYSGDQNYRAKNSPTLRQVIGKSLTSGELYVTPNPTLYVVNLSCGVSTTGPFGPTGTVTFKNGLLLLGTVPLMNGVATLANTHLPAGVASLRAFYNGDAFNEKSASQTYTLSVYAPSTTTITSFQNPSRQGSAVRFKATVTSPVGVPTGMVTFTAGTQTLATVRLTGGKANLVTSALPAGTTTVTATYSGEDYIFGSSGWVMQTVH